MIDDKDIQVDDFDTFLQKLQNQSQGKLKNASNFVKNYNINKTLRHLNLIELKEMGGWREEIQNCMRAGL